MSVSKIGRFSTLGMACAMALAATAACGKSQPEGGAAGSGAVGAADLKNCDASKYTVKVGFGPMATPAVQLAVTQMQSDYPGLKFEAEPAASGDYNDLTKQVVSDIAVGKRADLINTGLNQIPFWVDTYHPAPIDTAKLPSGYQTQFLGAGTYGGKVYMAPFQVSAPVLLVNRTLVKQAGVDPDVPVTSFDQLAQNARTVTQKTGAPSVNISTDALPDWFAQALVQGSGGTWVGSDGQAAFGDASGVKALSLWNTLSKDKTLLNTDMNTGFAQFVSGQLPYFFYATSRVAAVQEGVGAKFEWIAEDLPTSSGGAPGALPAGGNGWLILSEDSCKVAFATAMIEKMLSKESSLAASGKQYSYIPVNKEAATELLGGSGATDQLKYAWSYDKPLTAWGGFKGSKSSEIQDAVKTMAQGLATGGDPAATVGKAADRVDSLIGK